MLDAEAVCGTRVCPPHSSCIDLHCVCDPLYVGPSCEVSYEAELGRGALVAFDLGVVASNLGVVAVATYVMQRRCRRIELRWRVNEPIQALLFAGLAAVVRIVQYGVRPATLGTWLPRTASEIAHSVPEVALAAAYVVVTLFFVRTAAAARERQLAAPPGAVELWANRVAVPGMVAALCVFGAVVVGSNVLLALGVHARFMLWLRTATYCLFVACFMALFGAVAARLLRHSSSALIRDRLHTFVHGAAPPAAASVLAAALTGALDAARDPALWLALAAVMRLSEAGLALVLALTFRPPPRQRQLSTDTVRFAVSSRDPLVFVTDMGGLSAAGPGGDVPPGRAQQYQRI